MDMGNASTSQSHGYIGLNQINKNKQKSWTKKNIFSEGEIVELRENLYQRQSHCF